jgi:hypothetical protein
MTETHQEKLFQKINFFNNSGIYYIASDHSDNSQKSVEECKIVKKTIQ